MQHKDHPIPHNRAFECGNATNPSMSILDFNDDTTRWGKADARERSESSLLEQLSEFRKRRCGTRSSPLGREPKNDIVRPETPE